MTKLQFVFMCVAFLALSARAADRVPRIDLDNGVALTGNGRTLTTNPAALPDFQGRLVDLAVYQWTDYGLFGQLSSNLAENIAVGVGFDHYGTQTQIVPGIGATTGKLSFGISTTIVPGSYGFEDFIIGMRWDKNEDLSFAVVSYDVPTLKSFVVGVGVARSQKVKGDLDMALQFAGSNYDLMAAEARLAVSYVPSRTVWMMARLRLPVVPQIFFDRRNIELGLHVWLTNKIALYALYQSPLSDIVLGLKLKI